MNNFALGTVQFGQNYGISNNNGQVPPDEVKAILSTALSAGIQTFDTAINYGNSEKILGNNLPKDNIDLITKISIDACSSDEINTLIENSLKRLHQQRIYAIMLHDPNELLSANAEDNFFHLQTLKPKFCDKIGVSVYHPEQLLSIIEKFHIDIVQIPANIFDQRFLNKELLLHLKSKKIEIHARSLFLQGLLLMDNIEIPSSFNNFNVNFTQYEEFCRCNKLSKLQSCLSFAKTHEDIDKFVVGVCSNMELLEIINTYKKVPKLPSTSFIALSSTEQNLINPSLWRKKTPNND